MGSEYSGPLPDPEVTQRRPPSVPPAGENILPEASNRTMPYEQDMPDAEPVYREHVSGMLPTPAPVPQSYAPYASYPPQYPYKPQPPTQEARTPQTAQPHPGWRPYLPPPQPGQPGAPPVAGYPPAPAPGQPFYGPPGQGNRPPYPAMPQYAYPGYPPMSYPYGYGQQQGYPAMAYPYYPYYPYNPYLARPRRDGYQFGIAITSLIGAILATLGGLGCAVVVLLIAAIPSVGRALKPEQVFAGIALYCALAVAGLAGGGFSLYHSIQALRKKSSKGLVLPSAWIFFGLYIALLVFGFTLGTLPQVYNNRPVAILILLLSGIFPAFCFMALALRRVRQNAQTGAEKEKREEPTTWRRFVLALTSGATAAIAIAGLLELVLMILAYFAFHVDRSVVDSTDIQVPNTPNGIVFMVILVSVIAPVVEELAKPVAVAIYIGRIRTAASAFVLGFACGVGFDLVETAGYIGQLGPQHWIDIAIQRSTAGLLHGFGAGMGALFWYYVTKRKSVNKHILMGFACLGYAMLQHAIWNGTFLVALLPAPVGPFLDHGTIPIGNYQLPGGLLVYAVEAALMFAFFLYVTKRLRAQLPPFPTRGEKRQSQVEPVPVPIKQQVTSV